VKGGCGGCGACVVYLMPREFQDQQTRQGQMSFVQQQPPLLGDGPVSILPCRICCPLRKRISHIQNNSLLAFEASAVVLEMTYKCP
jgi:hypothetical protein